MKRIKEVLMQRVPQERKQMTLDVQECPHNSRNRKLFCISLKRKMRAAKMAPAFSRIRVELYMEPRKEVTAVRYYNTATSGFPVCPNCGYAMEREFQKHCEECGQLLGWKKFVKDQVTVQRITGTKGQRENAIRPEKTGKYGNTPICLK